MVAITLPDQSVRQFDHAVTVAEMAASIGAGLAKAALGGRVDGKLVDTAPASKRRSIAIVTDKRCQDGLDMIRHSTAHLLAYAVKVAVSRGPGDDRPGDRKWFLLRFFVQAAVHAGRPRRHRKEDDRSSQKGFPVIAQSAAAGSGGSAIQGTWASITRRKSSPRFRQTKR